MRKQKVEKKKMIKQKVEKKKMKMKIMKMKMKMKQWMKKKKKPKKKKEKKKFTLWKCWRMDIYMSKIENRYCSYSFVISAINSRENVSKIGIRCQIRHNVN